jgi:hypothetical protein
MREMDRPRLALLPEVLRDRRVVAAGDSQSPPNAGATQVREVLPVTMAICPRCKNAVATKEVGGRCVEPVYHRLAFANHVVDGKQCKESGALVDRDAIKKATGEES